MWQWETQMYRTDFETQWEKARVVCSERTALEQEYYQGWHRSPAQVGCMRLVLGAGALGSPRGMGWRGRREGGSGWGTHVNPWLIHVNVWQKPLKYCKVISLQLIGKKNNNVRMVWIKRSRKWKWKLPSHVRLFANPRTMEFSRTKYWSQYPFPSPADLLNPEIKPGSPLL